jgi:hypothetical protein
MRGVGLLPHRCSDRLDSGSDDNGGNIGTRFRLIRANFVFVWTTSKPQMGDVRLVCCCGRSQCFGCILPNTFGGLHATSFNGAGHDDETIARLQATADEVIEPCDYQNNSYWSDTGDCAHGSVGYWNTIDRGGQALAFL